VPSQFVVSIGVAFLKIEAIRSYIPFTRRQQVAYRNKIILLFQFRDNLLDVERTVFEARFDSGEFQEMRKKIENGDVSVPELEFAAERERLTTDTVKERLKVSSRSGQ
jgi:hypothetical protein